MAWKKFRCMRKPNTFRLPTIRLFDSWCDGAHKVFWSHINFSILHNFQRCKIAKNLVWCGICTDTVLISNDLQIKNKNRILNTNWIQSIWTCGYYLRQKCKNAFQWPSRWNKAEYLAMEFHHMQVFSKTV